MYPTFCGEMDRFPLISVFVFDLQRQFKSTKDNEAKQLAIVRTQVYLQQEDDAYLVRSEPVTLTCISTRVNRRVRTFGIEIKDKEIN